MKLLFTRFPLESALGGAEIQTMSLMKGLIAKGHAVAFVGSCPTLLKLTREEGIPGVALEIGPPPVSKWHALSFTWRKQMMQQKLGSALEQFHDIDAICMLSLPEKILLTPLALQKGIPVFWIEHDRVGPWLTKNPWLPKLREMSGKVTTVAVSELSRKIYEELGFKNVVAIPNGIDIHRFEGDEIVGRPPLSPQPPPPRGEGESLSKNKQKQNSSLPPAGEGLGMGVGEKSHQTASNTLHIGCVARLTSDKGVDLLIHAAKDVPQVDLTIVGSGREEGYLRSIIDRDGDRIKIIPKMQDLGSFYRSIDVLVLPSREHDPFGLVAAEAMSLGIPVIVTDATGIAGYLHHDHDAVIIPADELGALKQAMERMLDTNLREAIGNAGNVTASEKFSLSKMIDAYARLLR